ncbi:hypothetical protein ACO9S2_08995 [Nitrospira sp. NS4]|uniref:hypothetical protein n=1 Tax=Nitrospira sp. NS4 TaxID=3414498 RepID=UPI003C2C2220
MSLVNFSTFIISKRKTRMGRNPGTGRSLQNAHGEGSGILVRERAALRSQVTTHCRAEA